MTPWLCFVQTQTFFDTLYLFDSSRNKRSPAEFEQQCSFMFLACAKSSLQMDVLFERFAKKKDKRSNILYIENKTLYNGSTRLSERAEKIALRSS